jgi:hypothetical protein
MEVGDLILGDGNDPHAGERQSFVEPGDVLLIARQPVEGSATTTSNTPSRASSSSF